MSCKYSDNVMCSDRAMCKGCPCEEVAKSTVIELMTELSKKGIETDFLYEKRWSKWLLVRNCESR